MREGQGEGFLDIRDGDKEPVPKRPLWLVFRGQKMPLRSIIKLI